MKAKRIFKNYRRESGFSPAFTLAEVLITITIVGVVAAMTLPTLIKKIDKVRYKNAYQRTRSVLLQSMRSMKAADEITGYKTTEEFMENYKKHAKVVHECPAGNLKGCFPEEFQAGNLEYNIGAIKTAKNLGRDWDVDTNVVGFVLLDGTSVIMAYDTSCNDSKPDYCAAFAFDMNGINSTNRFTANGESDIGTLNASFFELCGLPLKFDKDGNLTNKQEIQQLAMKDPNILACIQDNQDKLDTLASSGTGGGGGGGGGRCLAAGTKIVLADGSSKFIEDVDYNDELLVWNFDEGKYDFAKPIWIKVEEEINQYNLLTFSDGTQLKTINQHRIFNKEAGKFTYPMTDETPIGTTTLMSDGREVQLVSKEVVHENVKFYNLITSNHFNCFANGVCTSNRFNNLYPIKDYKFVKDNRVLVSYDKYSNIISKEWYEDLRLAEMPADLVDSDYLENMKRLDKKSLLINI